MKAWYIDGLDARAGLCFASHRVEDLLSSSFENGPSVFIGPPFFEPEFLADRITGLGATHRSFQLGLFRDIGSGDAGEIAFEHLEDVIDFVRRCYVGGGEGDGGDGGGGAPGVDNDNPQRPDGGVDGDQPFDYEGVSATLLREIDDFAKSCPGSYFSPSQDPRGTSSSDSRRKAETGSKKWFLNLQAAGLSQSYQEILARAGLRIGTELFYRLPARQNILPRSLWLKGMVNLGAAFDRNHILPSDFLSTDLRPLVEVCEQIINRVGDTHLKEKYLSGPYRGEQFAVAMLSIATRSGFTHEYFWDWSDINQIFELFGRPSAFGYPQLPLAPNHVLVDPLEELSSWPVPSETWPVLGANGQSASVLDLMERVLASPEELVKRKPACQWATAELVIFGAACIVSASEASVLLDSSAFDQQDVVGRVCAWLAAQFPQRLLPQPINDLIATTRDAKYTGESTNAGTLRTA